MGHLGKYLSLLSVLSVAVLCTSANNANANTNSDELYSESVYIQKSAAEVPTSLESNARPNSEQAQMTAAADQAIESISDLDNTANGKKITERKPAKKSAE